MTNEPPRDDGEQLVEADLPGMGERGPDPEPPSQPPSEPPEPDLSPAERVDQAIRNTEETARAEEQARAQQFEQESAEFFDALKPDPFDAPVEDSVIEELDIGRPISQEEADRGLHGTEDSAAVDAEPGTADGDLLDSLPQQQPFEDNTIRRAIETEISPESRLRQPPEPDPTNDSDGSVDADSLEGDDLVEADLPTTSTGEFTQPDGDAEPATEAERSFDEIVDDRIRQIGENLEADELARESARRERTLEAMRREYGDDVDVEALYRHDELQRTRESFFDRVTPETALGKFLTLVLAGAGVAIAIFMAFAIFGGGSDDPESQVEVPADAATEVATVAPTVEGTIPPQPEYVRLERLALDAVAALADSDGDLWLTLALEDGVSVDPDTLSFFYAFALGAAVQADNGYNGAYYSVAGGQSYAEAVFGSSDFPRISNAFNATFQVDQASLWITDDGRLAIELPGDTPGSGLDASLFGPDTPVIAGVSFLVEEGGTGEGGFDEFTLGEISAGLDLPGSGWTEIDPDSEPLRLDVPDTSNRN